MSAEENKALVRRYEDEKRNKNNLAIIDELVAEGAIVHDPSGDRRITLAALKTVHAQQRESFPDLSIEIGPMVAEGDLVSYLYVMRGAFSRDIDTSYGRFPATGKTVTHPASSMCRIADGKIVEIWNRADSLSLFEQMGATLSPPRASG